VDFILEGSEAAVSLQRICDLSSCSIGVDSTRLQLFAGPFNIFSAALVVSAPSAEREASRSPLEGGEDN